MFTNKAKQDLGDFYCKCVMCKKSFMYGNWTKRKEGVLAIITMGEYKILSTVDKI